MAEIEITGSKLDTIEAMTRLEIAKGLSSRWNPDTVLALVILVRRLKAEVLSLNNLVAVEAARGNELDVMVEEGRRTVLERTEAESIPIADYEAFMVLSEQLRVKAAVDARQQALEEAEQAVFRCDDEFEAAAAIRALKDKEPGSK